MRGGALRSSWPCSAVITLTRDSMARLRSSAMWKRLPTAWPAEEAQLLSYVYAGTWAACWVAASHARRSSRSVSVNLRAPLLTPTPAPESPSEPRGRSGREGTCGRSRRCSGAGVAAGGEPMWERQEEERQSNSRGRKSVTPLTSHWFPRRPPSSEKHRRGMERGRWKKNESKSIFPEGKGKQGGKTEVCFGGSACPDGGGGVFVWGAILLCPTLGVGKWVIQLLHHFFQSCACVLGRAGQLIVACMARKAKSNGLPCSPEFNSCLSVTSFTLHSCPAVMLYNKPAEIILAVMSFTWK